MNDSDLRLFNVLAATKFQSNSTKIHPTFVSE